MQNCEVVDIKKAEKEVEGDAVQKTEEVKPQSNSLFSGTPIGFGGAQTGGSLFPTGFPKKDIQ